MNSSSTDLSAFNGVAQPSALQTQEEEEATEDIRRRQEELQILIKNVLDEYDYEESTFDSTTNVSLDDANNADSNRQSVFEEPQIQTLYQGRVEEVKALKQELELVKARLEEETKVNANRNALANSEIQQCKISLQQSQALLVQKNSELAQYEIELQEATNKIGQLQTDLNKLKTDNSALRSCNEDLQGKLLEMEKDNAFSTNKVTERELQMQYVEQISFLEHQVNEWKKCVKEMEENTSAVIRQLENTVREKTDKLAEQNKYITDLQTNLEHVSSQSHLYMELLEKTRAEYTKYKAETKGSKELLELIKAGKLGQFTDVSSAIHAMKQKLHEKDQEIKAVKKSWMASDSHNGGDASTFNASDITGLDSSLKHQSIADASHFKADLLNKKLDELASAMNDKENQLVKAHEKIQVLASELKQNKHTFKRIIEKTKSKNERLSGLVQKLQNAKNMWFADKEKLEHKIKDNESYIAELREKIMEEQERCENVISILQGSNRCIEEMVRQLGYVEIHARQVKERLKSSRQMVNTGSQTDEGPSLLQVELELREQMQEDFRRKLDNIETKYKAVTGERVNCDQLKQQVLRLTAKLHKYKSLYDASRKAMMDYLMMSSEQVKYLESRILAIDEQRTQDKLLLEEYKKKLHSATSELAKFTEASKKQAKTVAKCRKQTVKICKSITAIRDKTKEIKSTADQKVKDIEIEYRRKQRELENSFPI